MPSPARRARDRATPSSASTMQAATSCGLASSDPRISTLVLDYNLGHWSRLLELHRFGYAISDGQRKYSLFFLGDRAAADSSSLPPPVQLRVFPDAAFANKYDASGSVVWTRQFGTSA